MDLSKVYDCIPHELLIAKLKFYDIENVSPRLLLYYLTNSKQKTKNGSSFILWRKIDHRTLQVVYNEYNKSYDELPKLNNKVSIHQRNLQYLALKVFKSLLNPI